MALKDFMKYFYNNEVLFSDILKNYFSIFQELFLKYAKNMPGKDEDIYSWNVTGKHFMKYFCNNDVIFPVILMNYFPIFQETFLKYSNNIPTNERANYF